MTKRIAKLEELGFVARVPDPRDGRGVLVELTPAGRRLIDRVGARYIEEERAVIASLDAEEQATMADLLRRVLLALEGPSVGPTASWVDVAPHR